MKVFLTGATGLIGAHSALALLEAGHGVRLLVRDRALAREYFAARGHELDDRGDLVEADMRDADAVRRGLAGCDAVLHAAAMVSVDPAHADELQRTNLEGIAAVLETAWDAGIRRLVYVSSVAAFFRPGATHLDESSPLGASSEAYLRSKQACERRVRELQGQGRSIQITYPVGVYAPDDPKLSESNRGLIAMLSVVPRTTTGIQFVDARDLAEVHLRLLTGPAADAHPTGRYVVGGHYHPWAEHHALLEAATGRSIPSPRVPGAVLRGLGRALDVVRRVWPIEFPLTSESMEIATRWPLADSSLVRERLGLEFRPALDTIRETVDWLAAAGHVSPGLAGAAALPPGRAGQPPAGGVP